MKFKQSEHDVFQNEIESSGLDYNNFAFVKTKGWLSITHHPTNESYQFHRKSETKLNSSGGWVKRVTYMSKQKGSKNEFKSFDELRNQFHNWLNLIQE